jgi:hypothetical protein
MLLHDRLSCHRNGGFRGWRAVAQSTVPSLRVVVFPPFATDVQPQGNLCATNTEPNSPLMAQSVRKSALRPCRLTL